MKNYFHLIWFLVFLSSCGTMQIGTEDNFRKELQVYVNGSIDKVILNYGHSDQLSEAPNGNRLFIYTKSETSTSPVNCTKNKQGQTNCTGGDTSTDWCKTYFEVNMNNIVIDATFKGNDCGACEDKEVLYCL